MSENWQAREPFRTFEDLEVGELRTSTPRTVTQEEILAFARQYDPQWFHTDPDAATDAQGAQGTAGCAGLPQAGNTAGHGHLEAELADCESGSGCGTS